VGPGVSRSRDREAQAPPRAVGRGGVGVGPPDRCCRGAAGC
jgi:hypothetical protein